MGQLVACSYLLGKGSATIFVLDWVYERPSTSQFNEKIC